MLEDKSSREGLIENSYYFYFVHTIQNLLTILAIDYLSDVRADSLGIQQSYVKHNAELAEAARIRKELPFMLTSAEQARRVPSKETWTAAIRDTAFTGSDEATESISLKHR